MSRGEEGAGLRGSDACSGSDNWDSGAAELCGPCHEPLRLIRTDDSGLTLAGPLARPGRWRRLTDVKNVGGSPKAR